MLGISPFSVQDIVMISVGRWGVVILEKFGVKMTLLFNCRSDIVWKRYSRFVEEPQEWLTKYGTESGSEFVYNAQLCYMLQTHICDIYTVRVQGNVHRVVVNFCKNFADFIEHQFRCFCPYDDAYCLCKERFCNLCIKQICHDFMCHLREHHVRFHNYGKIFFVILCEKKKLTKLASAVHSHIYERCECFNFELCDFYDGSVTFEKILYYLSEEGEEYSTSSDSSISDGELSETSEHSTVILGDGESADSKAVTS